MLGAAEGGKMRRRIFICWGFWPQWDVLSAGAGGEGRESTGEEIWVVTGILLFTVSRFMVVTWIITLKEWHAEEWSHCYQCWFSHLTNFLFFKIFLSLKMWWKCCLFDGEFIGGSAKCGVLSYWGATWHACVTSPPPSSLCCTCRVEPPTSAGFWSEISCPESSSTSSWLVTTLSCQCLIRLFLSSSLGSWVISF